jgi:hypothetical protein
VPVKKIFALSGAFVPLLFVVLIRITQLSPATALCGALLLGVARPALAAHALECQDWQKVHPQWLWCDDFESNSRLESDYFDVNRADGRLAVVSDTAYAGTHSLRNAYVKGVEDSGSVKLSIGATPLRPKILPDHKFDELYWRFYLKTSDNWIGQPLKLTRATIVTATNWSQAAIGHLWDDHGLGLGLDPASGVVGGAVVTTHWNDFDHLRWLGKADGQLQIYAPANRGTWFCVEVHLKLNTPGRSGGVFEFWVDNAPQARKDELNWRGTYTGYGINVLTLEGWINGVPPRPRALPR